MSEDAKALYRDAAPFLANVVAKIFPDHQYMVILVPRGADGKFGTDGLVDFASVPTEGKIEILQRTLDYLQDSTEPSEVIVVREQ